MSSSSQDRNATPLPFLRNKSYGLYINGQYVDTGRTFPIKTPLPVPEFSRLEMSTLKSDEIPGREGLLEAALQGVHETFEQVMKGFFPLAERMACLERLRAKLVEQSENMAQIICREVGKPIDLARAEVSRGVSTLEWTIREAPTFFAHQGLPTLASDRLNDVEGWIAREPRGPLLAISPFNYPLNLVLHKVAPALAAGCPVVLKPSPKGMLTALTLVDFLHASELPAGMLSLIQCDNEQVAPLCRDPRIAQISFTGSAAVGWKLVEGIEKPYSLELGGNAPVFVDESADLADAAKKSASQAFAYAGQVCISVQNIFVHKKIANEFRKRLIEEVERLAWGEASVEGVVAGPIIEPSAAERLRKAKQRVLSSGARVLAEAGAPRGKVDPNDEKSAYLRPTLFENVSAQDSFYSEELFGPFANFIEVESFEKFIEQANASKFRLQAGVFTRDLKNALVAARRLRFGGVLVNEAPSLRFEPMPYGGRGRSGEGREGPRYALEAFTELKSVLIRPL
jgi:acyl-CoA reductase-like NAD-dependent aldehyde dehydrogenase